MTPERRAFVDELSELKLTPGISSKDAYCFLKVRKAFEALAEQIGGNLRVSEVSHLCERLQAAISDVVNSLVIDPSQRRTDRFILSYPEKVLNMFRESEWSSVSDTYWNANYEEMLKFAAVAFRVQQGLSYLRSGSELDESSRAGCLEAALRLTWRGLTGSGSSAWLDTENPGICLTNVETGEILDLWQLIADARWTYESGEILPLERAELSNKDSILNREIYSGSVSKVVPLELLAVKALLPDAEPLYHRAKRELTLGNREVELQIAIDFVIANVSAKISRGDSAAEILEDATMLAQGIADLCEHTISRLSRIALPEVEKLVADKLKLVEESKFTAQALVRNRRWLETFLSH